MRRFFSGFALLVLFLGFRLPVCGADEPVDLLQTLYQKRFHLDAAGVPLVLIGVEQNLSLLEISGTKGLDLLPNGQAGVRISGAKTVEVRLKSGTAGRVNHHVALTSVPQAETDRIRQTREELSKRGAVPKEQGYVISMGTRMLDTRRMLFSLGPFTAVKAQEILARERSAFPHAFVHADFATLPGGQFEVVSKRPALQVTQQGALMFEAREKGELSYAVDGKTHRVPGRLVVVMGMDGKLTLVNEISIEAYLEGILPSEMFPSAPAEALKAQAVAARGQVLAKMGQRHNTEPFHLCSKVHCQVYDGLEKVDPRTTQAVRQTAGQVLFDQKGFPVDTVYSSSCGGHGEHNEHVWGGKPNENLRGRPDGPPRGRSFEKFLSHPPKSFCGMMPRGAHAFRWKVTKTPEELQKSLATVGFSGKLREIRVKNRGVSGRILEVELVGSPANLLVKGELVIRRALGNLRSSAFVVNRNKDGSFTFTGAGFGHGVGMCQWGAMGRAQAGQNVQQILNHYYPGSQLFKLY